MIVQKLKDNKLIAYEHEVNEIESFSLLVLDKSEWENLYNLSTNWVKDNYKLTLIYENKDSIDKYFKLLATQHKNNNPLFKDVSKKYVSNIPGTSMLIRDVKNHIIRIAFRKGDKCDINKLFIPNTVRESFFADTKRCSYLSRNGKYAIDIVDEGFYIKWSKYMNEMYLKGIN